MTYDIDVLGCNATLSFQWPPHRMPVITHLMQGSFMTLRKRKYLWGKCSSDFNTNLMKKSTGVFLLGTGASPHHGTWSLNLLTLPLFIYCINAFKSFITFSQKDWGFDPALLLSCISMSTASNCAMWCIPHCLWYPAMRLNLSEGVYLQKSCALGRRHLILLSATFNGYALKGNILKMHFHHSDT